MILPDDGVKPRDGSIRVKNDGVGHTSRGVSQVSTLDDIRFHDATIFWEDEAQGVTYASHLHSSENG